MAAWVLLALVLVAGLWPATSRAGAVVLAAISLLWLLVNSPMEVGVLVRVSSGHGLTTVDLVGLAGLGIAAYRYRLSVRSRR